MAQLPPPRLPGLPPDRPPIRRPGEHLPLPTQLGPDEPTPAPTGTGRKRLLVVIGLVAFTALLGALAVFLLRGDGDDLNTKAAAATIDEAVGDADDSGEVDCPIDDLPDALASAVDPIGDDALYDVIDLGSPMNNAVTSDGGRPTLLLCGIVDPQAPGDVDIEAVGLGLSLAPDDFVEYSEERADDDGADTEIDELGGFRGGTVYHQIVTSEAETYVDISWVNEDVLIGMLISGEDVERFDTEDLERGLTDIIPSVVDELAGED